MKRCTTVVPMDLVQQAAVLRAMDTWWLQQLHSIHKQVMLTWRVTEQSFATAQQRVMLLQSPFLLQRAALRCTATLARVQQPLLLVQWCYRCL
jgi:hypothetical protein